jgi:predicted secreted protein
MHPTTRMALAALIGSAFIPAPAPAQTLTAREPQAVLNLNASASVEVANDLLSITFTASRDGADPNTVQAALKQALDGALAEARKAARPGQLDVNTGNFALYPRYGNKGGISGWQGSAELVVQGRDMSAIGQLSGRLSSMTIARVAYSLSREAREKVEGDVTAQAIARYRSKAADTARQFGFAGYTIREVQVTVDEPAGPVPMMRAKAMTSSDESLPVEPGKGSVTATVSGSVQMN